jgi:nucleoside-diphosphate-sugar epimerase
VIKKILITGGNGFVGRNIRSALDKYYNIFSPTKKNLNLLDQKKINLYLRKIKPDLIIHSAGLVGGILKNVNNQKEFLIQNYEMGKNLVISASKNKIKNFLNISSSCIYPKNLARQITEDDLLNGPLEPTNEGYALAKLSILKLCLYLNKVNKFNYKSIIPCNLYGPEDNFKLNSAHLLAAIINKTHKAKIKKKKVIKIWGNGKPKREFMFINDFVDALILIIKNFANLPPLINVGTGKDYTVRKYYKIVAKEIEFKGKFEYDLSKPNGMKRKLMDISKLNKLGFVPKHSIQDGIKKTYEFYKKK